MPHADDSPSYRGSRTFLIVGWIWKLSLRRSAEADNVYHEWMAPEEQRLID